MSISKTKFFSSFTFLNLTQIFTALNDNLYKLLLIFFLISLKGQEHSNTILSVAGAIFVIPFILFASLAGTLADRFSKRMIIYFTRLLEILTTALGILAFTFKSVIGGYLVLFLMATHSSIFSPCKYGIIPEIVRKDRISQCNGIITASTYLAIIVGTFLASFLTEVTHKNFILSGSFCVLVALIGATFSLGIEKTKPQAAKKKVSARFISEIIKTLVRAKKRRYLLTTIIFGAYFLFMGAYTQLNIIPFTLQSLKLNEVVGGYLFLMTAIGIGIGAFFAGRLSGKEVELGFVPLSSLGITVSFVGLYLFDSNLYVVVFFLVMIGFFGGFFIVPLDTFIQFASPNEDRGQNVASANFLSFIGVILASLLLAVLGNMLLLTAAEGFLFIGLLTLLMGVFLFLLYADHVLRLFAATFAKLFWRIRVAGKHHAYLSAPMLLVAPRASWVDTLIVMATLPRFIRYIVPIREGKKRYLFFYRLLWLFPIDIEHFSPVGHEAIAAIRSEIEAGRSVCLMHPIDFPAKTLKEWETKLEKLSSEIKVPMLPVHISRHAYKKGKLKMISVKVFYGHTKSLN